MQQIATVLVTYVRIVPVGGSRNRAEAALRSDFSATPMGIVDQGGLPRVCFTFK